MIEKHELRGDILLARNDRDGARKAYRAALDAATAERFRKVGVLLVGDLPIFVAHHSADCWTRPDLFQLDARGDSASRPSGAGRYRRTHGRSTATRSPSWAARIAAT